MATGQTTNGKSISGSGSLTAGDVRAFVRALPDSATIEVSTQSDRGSSGWTMSARWVEETPPTRASTYAGGPYAGPPGGSSYHGPYGDGVGFYDSH